MGCSIDMATTLPDPLRVPEGEDKSNKDKFFAENVEWLRVWGKDYQANGLNNWEEIFATFNGGREACRGCVGDPLDLVGENLWPDSGVIGQRDKIGGHENLAKIFNKELCIRDWTTNNLKHCNTKEGELVTGEDWLNNEQCGCFDAAKEYNGADVSSALLTGLYAMSNCSDAFNWGGMADNFCAKPENFKASIGNGRCLDRNPGARKEYCKLKDNIVKDTDNCSKAKLGEDDYNDVGIAYCKRDGDKAEEGGKRQPWCKCYNLDTGVCETDLDAAGCRTARDGVEKNKKYFSAEEYDILRNNMVCRPGECSSGFLPKNYKDQCKPSYRICGQDVDIGLLSNSQLLVKCHSGEEDLPDFMRTGEQKGRSRYEREKDKRRRKKREPPFDKGLLSKTPIKSWPRRWSTDDKDAQYIVSYTITSAASCLLCAGGLFMLMGKE